MARHSAVAIDHSTGESPFHRPAKESTRYCWRLFFLTIPLAIVGSFYRAGMMASSGAFIPQLPAIVHKGLLFVAGLLLYRPRDALFPHLTRHCWKCALAGFVVFIAAPGAFDTFTNKPQAAGRV